MLGKLLKYDLKWIYKVVVVFYILAFIFSALGRGLGMIENSLIFSIVSQILFSFAIAMMVSSLINCFMRLWARMIKNMYKDESYLTHTIPVEKKTIYLSKVLTAIICIFTTVLIIIVCLFICYYSDANMQFLKQILEITASTYNITVIKLLVLISAVVFFELLFFVLIGYVAIILGYRSNQSKMIKTIIIGFGMYFLTQTISLCIVFVFGLFNANVMNLINTTEMINIEIIKSLMYGAISLYAIYTICYYIIGKKALEKGVNVD